MKVLHLAHYYWPHVGGVEKHLALLAEALQEKQYETAVLTKQYEDSLPLSEQKGSVAIHRFKVNEGSKIATKISTWQGIWKHKDMLFGADHIHVHDVFWWIAPILPLLLLKRQKITMTFHGYEGADAPKWNQRFWHQLAQLGTQGNLCIGGFHKKYYGVLPTLVSFGAVEPFSQKNHVPKTKKQDTKRAIFIGRLEEDTGILEYVRAIKLLRDVGEAWYLDLYGEGSQKAAAKAFVAKHQLDKLVRFHGFVAAADTFLPRYSVAFVSRYLAILEALSANVLVIAQYNNAIKKDYLLLDSPFAQWISVAHTAEEIATHMQQKKLPPISAKRWADEQTWQKMAETYVSLWKQT